MKSSGAGGVVGHEIHWDGTVPVGVTLHLKGGVVVRLDLPSATVEEVGTQVLTEKKRQWVAAIGDYLVRQELLRRTEEARGGAGATAVEFEPRPDGGRIWWG
ncbi:MAG: hypothetical protein HQL77_06625 [Magnetococcales bacterium]|nr:hypothetical protein [Magnetococcales bacterium]